VTKNQENEAAKRVFKKQAEKERDAQTALAEHRMAQEAIAKRTAELRALRLEREAKKGPAVKERKSSRKTSAGTKGSLSDWFDEQNKSGRRT
jgi:hypothetical protein